MCLGFCLSPLLLFSSSMQCSPKTRIFTSLPNEGLVSSASPSLVLARDRKLNKRSDLVGDQEHHLTSRRASWSFAGAPAPKTCFFPMFLVATLHSQ